MHASTTGPLPKTRGRPTLLARAAIRLRLRNRSDGHALVEAISSQAGLGGRSSRPPWDTPVDAVAGEERGGPRQKPAQVAAFSSSWISL
nr:hypothetical protein [Streptomyces flavidovirens]